MSNPLLQKSFTAGAAIAAYSLAKFSAAGTVIAAAAATDNIIGAVNEVGPASGERCDVVVEGIANVLAGAAVALGALVTSDASGRAITAAPAAGSNVRVIGYAVDAATAANDIIRVMIAPSMMQG